MVVACPSDAADASRLYTVRQLAEKYGVSDRTVWRWIRKGAVQVVRKAPRTGVRVIDAPAN